MQWNVATDARMKLHLRYSIRKQIMRMIETINPRATASEEHTCQRHQKRHSDQNFPKIIF